MTRLLLFVIAAVVGERPWLDARDLQSEPWAMPRRWAYSLLHRYGVRVTERRWVIARAVLEHVLEGGDPTTQPESNTAARMDQAAAQSN